MGYTTSTVHGIEVPDSAEANNVPEDIGKVVTALEAGSIVKRLTGAAIAALTAPQKPAGLVVYNTTTGKLQISNGTTFSDLDATAVAAQTTANAALPKAGGTMSGNLNMNNAGYILNILQSGASNDAATVGQVNDVSASFVGGVTSGTTDSDSVITISLPTSPTGAWAVTYDANVAGGMHVNYGNGDDFFKVRFYTSGGSPVGAGQNYTVRWNAIAY